MVRTLVLVGTRVLLTLEAAGLDDSLTSGLGIAWGLLKLLTGQVIITVTHLSGF